MRFYLMRNVQGNPAVAKNHRFQNRPDPPLGLTAFFGSLVAGLHFLIQPRSTRKASASAIVSFRYFGLLKKAWSAPS